MSRSRKLPILIQSGLRVDVSVEPKNIIWHVFKDDFEPVFLNEFAKMFGKIWPDDTVARLADLAEIADNLDDETVDFLEELVAEWHRIKEAKN
jgi:hypothetical protein